MTFAAVVLAGGAARRLGGTPKPVQPIGGRPMVLRVLDAVASAHPRIVVGPPDLAGMLPDGVLLTSEEPPGGGPVAGLAAGVRLVPDEATQVAVLSGDLPFLTAAVVDGLRDALDGAAEAAVLLDDGGRRQWLCAVWHRRALAARLSGVTSPYGFRVRDLVGDAMVRDVVVFAGSGPPPWFDCDTHEDLRRAEEWADAEPG